MGSSEGGPTKVGCKGKNFLRVEKEQLCRSVMLVSQDRVVGNQQKAGVFWERITEHYNKNRPDGVRPLRSLETKWALIKHNVSKFVGIYNQIQLLHKSGSSAADTMRDAKELYRQKSPKNTDFLFEHCWLLLKDCPRWADGWTQPSTPRKRPAHECEGSNTQELDAGISAGAARSQSTYNERPGGVKAAKQDNMQQKMRDGALYAQAEATKSMAAVQMKKIACMEDQNMLLLMTMPIEDSAGEDAREYLRLRRGEELKKLRKRLSEEESMLQTQEARVFAAGAAGAVPQTDNALHQQRGWASEEARVLAAEAAGAVPQTDNALHQQRGWASEEARVLAVGAAGVVPQIDNALHQQRGWAWEGGLSTGSVTHRGQHRLRLQVRTGGLGR